MGEQVVKKKRVSDSKLNKEGPIMKTKRKRLDSIKEDYVSDDKPVVASKKRLVKSSEPVIKTRKVKTAKKEDSKPEHEKKKKRKPVKRKKKKDSDKKRINEEKMQEELVSDFLKEE